MSERTAVYAMTEDVSEGVERDRICVETVHALRELACDLEARGVASLYLFGSVARGESRMTSDVDLFIDPARSGFSLLDLADTATFIAERLGRRVDLATRDMLHPALKFEIEASAVRIF